MTGVRLHAILSYLFVSGRLGISNRLNPRRHSPLRLADTLRTRHVHLYQLLFGSLEACRQSRYALFQRERLNNQSDEAGGLMNYLRNYPEGGGKVRGGCV